MPRILLVESDVTLRKVVWLLLVKLGYDVVEAADATEASKLQQYLPADVLMTDTKTPEKGGLETTTQFRKHYPKVQIIATSGRSAIEICGYLPRASAQGVR